MTWQKFYASDAIVYGLKETVNNLRIAIYSMAILFCEVLVSIVVVGLPTLLFALWTMPSLRGIAVQARAALFSGSYGAIPAIIKDANISQVPLADKIGFAIAICAFIMLWSMFAAGYVRMILKFHDTGSVELKELFMGWHRGPRIFIGGIILGLGVMVGLTLFVVPGIYILVHGILFPFFIVDKNLGVFEALKRSFQAVRGQGWQIMALVIIGAALNFNPIIMILASFTKLLMGAFAYRRLTA